MLQLVALNPAQPTAYIMGGKTRIQGEVPHIQDVQTVRDLRDPRWRMSPRAAEAQARTQADWVTFGGELYRLTDAWRDQAHVQATLRHGYELWVSAGKPEPGGVRWRAGMKTAYAAKPGESYHGAGMSKDIDVGGLYHPQTGRGTDQTLAAFWEVARDNGWEPIIRHPQVDQSECWHFDHVGGMRHVFEAFREASRTNRKYAPAYSHTAMVANALFGTLPNQRPAHYIQAVLALAGHFPGLVDGDLGKMSKAALTAAGLGALTTETDHHRIVSAIAELGLGAEAMAAL
jgi:hypothetical protein